MMRKMIFRTLTAWLRIARLHFYVMTFIAYCLGASAAYLATGSFRVPAFIFGYMTLFFIEFATVLANELFDYDTDRINLNASLFTGGSRVLVEGRLSFRDVRTGILSSLALAVASGALLVTVGYVKVQSTLVLFTLGILLGLGYTVPPLKFSYRGLGEVVVGVTHSLYVVLCGYIYQGSSWSDPDSWLLSVPLFFATFSATTLSGIPDRPADRAVSKRTIAVLAGPRATVRISILSTMLAAASAVLLLYLGFLSGPVRLAILVVVPHGAAIVVMLIRFFKENHFDRTINPIMKQSLTYIIWFGVIPLADTLLRIARRL